MAWDKAALRMARLCGKGVIRAEDNQSMTALGCMVAVDVIGVGDVIDIVHESSQYMDDEPVDKLILGVSIVGLGTTIATIATLGASTPVAAGVSVLKIGARTGRIGAKLTKNLSGIFMKILDMSALRKAIKQDGAWTAARQVKKGKYINKAALKEANIVVGNLGTIKTQGRGLSTTMLVLKHSDSAGDIVFYKRVTGIFGKNTDGVITLLGKRIFKLGKTATKITTKLALKIGGMIMAALLAMLGVIGSLFGNIGVWLAKRLLLRFAL
jgi:hypothetical protein